MIRLRMTQEFIRHAFTSNNHTLIDGLSPDCGDCISVEMSPPGLVTFMFDDGKDKIVDQTLTYQTLNSSTINS